jgi:ankyrin repeat protein
MKFNIKLSYSFAAFLFSFSSLIYSQSEDQITSFTKAAKFDDISEVKSLIKTGVSPNTLDPKGNPMLFLAVKENSSKVIDYLTNLPSIDINLTNLSGETPLMIASIEGNLSIVKYLSLDKKANINSLGWTPLQYACTRGHLEVAEFLVVNGAKVNALSPNNSTALMMSVMSGNEYLVKYLLDNGADLKIRNQQGLTAIDFADIYAKPWIGDGLRSRWAKLYKSPYPESSSRGLMN